MDVSLGLTMAVVPLRIVLLHLTVWGLWTAALRPLSGDSVWDFFERAGNYGVPLAFLVFAGIPRRLRGWLHRCGHPICGHSPSIARGRCTGSCASRPACCCSVMVPSARSTASPR